VTPKVKVGVLLPSQPTDLAAWLREAAAFDAAGADALWLDLAPDPELDPVAVIAALAVLTHRSLLVARLPADTSSTTIDRLSHGRFVAHHQISGDWSNAEFPESRVAWREAHTVAAGAGAEGLLVQADPRLLDLLRNPDDDGDRRDLQLAVG
jgi:hypothetical protein